MMNKQNYEIIVCVVVIYLNTLHEAINKSIDFFAYLSCIFGIFSFLYAAGTNVLLWTRNKIR